MNPLVLAFLIGLDAGLLSLTAPAIVAWAAHQGRLDLHDSPLAFLGSTAAVAILTLLALAELIGDKLPSTPSRLKPVGLIARVTLGGLSGAAMATAGSQSLVLGAVLGAVGGLAGTFVGYTLRARLVQALRVPDFIIAAMGDAVAITGGLFIVTRL